MSRTATNATISPGSAKKPASLRGNKPIKKTLRPCMEESKDWEHTGNLYIEGDNLDVLKLLQESYLNSVKMIYIDPPYNTGNDFIYKDDFAMDKGRLRRADQPL
jgi:adenine-specific DNA-methyltransferase